MRLTLKSFGLSHFNLARGSDSKENIDNALREIERGDWLQHREDRPSCILEPFTPSVITFFYGGIRCERWKVYELRLDFSVCVWMCVFWRLRGVTELRLQADSRPAELSAPSRGDLSPSFLLEV